MDEQQLRSYLKRVTVELTSTKERLLEATEERYEPIAIVGMSCRYPGGVASPEELWKLLAEARDGIAPFPSDRGWDVERLYDPDPETPGASYVREGGFIEGPAEFDAGFFGIGPREALATDPQQRLLLEASWQALEDAGIDPGSLRGEQAGVFAGLMYHDYGGGGTPPPELEGYLATGVAGSVTSGRVAYELGLEGPAMTVDTACSSSLVTLHLAAHALRRGECSLALAGGVTVLANPGVFTEFSRQRGLSPDGRSKSFAEAADGVAWGEGVGMLVLERLSDAERNGHPVLATIKGSAVNQDGASNGLTAPNGPSQERVIRQALANARLQAKDIDAVEAHGTGTTLGDPIEAGALLATYGQERENGPLKLGSIKSNIGHTQAAAGVAGVIKMVLAMREGLLPKTLHVDAPSSKVDWEAGEIELLTEAQDWEPNGRPRRAGISSFGISGTNAHVILEEAPAAKAEDQAEGKGEPTLAGSVLLPLSAKSEPALQEAAGRLATHIRSNPELDPTDVSFSLATTRAAFKERAVAIGADRDELLTSLATLAEGKTSARAITASASEARLAYLFTGQGAQRLGMGKELYEISSVFAESFDRSCDLLSQELGTSLVEIVFAKETKKARERLTHTTCAQASLFALEVALFELLSSLGLKPDLLAGHSIGEIAAAYVAGVLSIEDATKLVAARAKLMGGLPEGGAMLAVAASEEQANEYLGGKEKEISLAAVNSPSSCVLSGEKKAIDAAQTHFEEEGLKTKRLEVSHAFHSPLMEPMLEEFAEVAKTLEYNPPQIPIISTQSGELLGEKATDPAYWVAQVREPVRFSDALASLKEQGAGAYLEIGPDPALSAMAAETFATEERPPALIATLREGQPEAEAIAAAIAGAHANGAKLDWSAYFRGTGAKRVPLPTYPFQRERFWLAGGNGAGDVSAAGLSDAEHPLLGAAVQVAQGEGERLLLTGRISLATHPWLADHAVAGAVLLPGTAFLELALHAAERVGCQEVTELTLQAPLLIPEQGGVQLQVTVAEPSEDGARQIEIYSRPETSGEEETIGWTAHATGSLSPDASQAPVPLESWPPEGAEPLGTDDLYERLAEIGLEYGPAFQGLHAAWRKDGEIYAEVSLADEQGSEAQSFGIHPALLDSVLHGIALAALAGGDSGQAGLPFSWSGVSLQATGAEELRAWISANEQGGTSLSLFDPSGAAVAYVGSLALREMDPGQMQGPSRPGESLFGLDWAELELSAPTEDSEAEVFELAPAEGEDSARAAREAAAAALQRAQQWLAQEDQEPARLVFLTRGAVATDGEEAPDPAAAAVWGLVRCAQLERPGAFVLVDTDGTDASKAALQAALEIADEPQLALREGVALAPRLARDSGQGEEGAGLLPPAETWRLDATQRGTLGSLALVPNTAVEEPLSPTGVRIAMRAAGLNFRDVLVALGLYPGEAPIGSEGAGTVLEVGSQVDDLAPGDRVMGLIANAFGPMAVAERSMLAPVPDEWDFEQAASVPIVFLTAHYGLGDLAALKKGEKVLIHAGAGGVGMAAVQLAQHLGAEVFATASPAKWGALREAGIAEDRIASSRDLDFKEKFLAQTEGEGVDVVLNALANEFVDASLELLPRGGRFLEMGKTDVRDPEEVAARHPGVEYRAFDVLEAGPERVQEMLVEIAGLFGKGALRHAPIVGWDVREAPEAFRFLREGSNVGKVVLGIPQPLDPQTTTLITGGTGGLGALVARHLAERHGARHLLLLSRSGERAEGARELKAELQELGAKATILACDVSDREQLKEAIDAIPAEHPLGAVIHSAGALRDGTIDSQDAEHLAHVFAPKADAAWHLHELTKGADLSRFVLFSSAAATLGSPGQANYGAANAFLDALAAKRNAEGLPATAVAWGLWADAGEMTSHLTDADLARMERAGIGTLATEQGLALFDQALGFERSLAVGVQVHPAPLRAMAQAGALPPILRGLVRVPARRRAASGSMATKLAAAPEPEREKLALEAVRAEVATVLGHSSPTAIPAEEPFKDLGFDSLAAVELRNRLVAGTGLTLPATLVFDYPTPAKLAAYLLGEMSATGAARKVAVKAQATDEPIAIVGMSCRYPGGVGSPEELWELLAEARDGIAPFPSDRGWDLERLYDPDPDSPLTSYVREGGFLQAPGDFDAEFFGIGPREALATDPQQRLLLESCWEALEDAGIDPGSLQGGSAGVFAGAMGGTYATGGAPPAELEGYLGTGLLGSVTSGRVAYELGLEGPAMTVDTACSSSLVTLHLAAQALRQGECDLALAGGVTVLATPIIFTEFSRQRGLSPDGRSKSFADAADGVAWGEGVGMLVLERLSDAERNGHPVLATIKGSAVNQDGASNGLTAPNGPSQERVIRQALANARLQAKDIDAVEAHGTGTTLGDPIEAGALLATYGQERENGPLRLGSIKSNIGHTQAAAGVAGVIKMVLAMREGLLPKTLHVDAPSSKVDWDSGEIELLTEAREWKPNGRPRRAGVSSFGISGTNAHVILEEAPQPSEVEEDEGGEPALSGAVLLPLSAKSKPALQEAAGRLASHLKDNPELDPTDVSYALATTRAGFKERAAAIGKDRDELLASLATLAEGQTSARAITASATDSKLAYLFTGQGAQRLGMGKELHEASPVFAESFDRSCKLLSQELGVSLKEIVFAKDSKKAKAKLTHTTCAQASLFAIEVALYDLLSSLGLKPDLLAGHSIGEIAAAHVSGVLSIEDATKLVAARAKLMGELPEGGAMLAVAAGEQEASDYLQGKESEISLAAVNSPSSCVLSGTEGAVEAAQAHFEEQGAKTKRLEVSHAFHSHLMEPMLQEFAKVAETLTYNEPRIPIVSSQSGELLGGKATDPAYWVAQVREPVRFANALQTLREQGAGIYLEIGPEPALSAMAAEAFAEEEKEPALIATLRGGQPEALAIATAIASAHTNGAKLDWGSHFEGTGAKRVPLPTYPFQRERFWLASMAGAGDVSAAGLGDAEHPLLGAAIASPIGQGLTLAGRLSLATHPWLADHVVAGAVLLPGSAFLELALHAAERVGCKEVAELSLQAPLVLPEQGAAQLQVTVSEPSEDGGRQVDIYSRPQGSEDADTWAHHATGSLSVEGSQAPEPLTSWPPDGAEPLEADDLYERLAEIGLEYGPAFQGLSAAWRKGEEIYAEVSLSDSDGVGAESFGIHPALLEAPLQAGAEELRLPCVWRAAQLHATGATALRVRVGSAEEGRQLLAWDETGAPLLSVDSLGDEELDPAQLPTPSAGKRHLYRRVWEEARSTPSNGAAPPALALLGETEMGELSAERHPDLTALIEAIDGEGTQAPDIVLAEAPAAEAGLPEAAHANALATLELLQAWAAAEPLASSRLVLLTRNAISTQAEHSADLGAAPLWGMVLSAHSEHPGRFALIDTDATEASAASLPAAFATLGEEPQVALRAGKLLVPRLAEAEPADERAAPIDPEATVLITGGTSGIGALLARHLASEHGARHLLLLSRSGERARGAEELKAELEELGAKTTIAACDVTDREQLRATIDSIDPEHPLGAIVHSAGRIDDGVLESLDAERLEGVMRPKVDAAWHLHELTKGADLSQFLLFSSAAGLLGGAAQSNYAAANAFLDALAHERRAQGLPATSLAWGLWDNESRLAGDLGDVDMERFHQQVRGRLGFVPLVPQQGLALLDAARALGEPSLAPVELDRAVLRAQGRAGALPPILRGIVRVPARRVASGSLALKLANVSEPERGAVVLNLVRAHTAAVLGHASAQEVDPDKPFKDLGFDSLAAVELRNRLVADSGLALPATMVFDYPNPAKLGAFLLGEATASGAAWQVAVKAQTSEEPIAIVGMACRYPGGVSSPEELWELVAAGTDGITEFPADRGWDVERLYSPDPEQKGTSYVRAGGFVHDAGEFDAEFFGISPREALATDPQQRLLLEVSWEALEDAGLDPASLQGAPIGVFAGGMSNEYGRIAPESEGYRLTGTSVSVLSGRVAYSFGLEGPAVTVDTACSSSLVSIHLGAQALRNGECSAALVGGVVVLPTPHIYVEISRQRGLSPDGRCKSFAEAADGAGFSEGVGMVLLERLSDAQRSGRPILAVLKGSAVNQDGASNGLSAPNGPSQQRVIRQALANARLDPAEVDAVEAHGTGTVLGDPIEAGALLATYGLERDEPLKLGSIKSNIGHTQAAAGVAGVIKMVMAMQKGLLPKTLHVDEPSSKVEWDAGKVELLTEPEEWKRNGRPRRAGVSSFGVSGTNAHAILEEAPAASDEAGEADATEPSPPIALKALPFPLSARTEPALRESAARLRSHLLANPDLEPKDLGHSLVSTRSTFERRATVFAAGRDELASGLTALAEGRETEGLVLGSCPKPREAVFVFPGHGSQWKGMALELLDRSPAFARYMAECDEALSAFTEWSTLDVLRGAEGAPSIERLDALQPALFALMVSLAKLWGDFGVRPAAVVGHSQGEIAAAHVAGGLSLEDAARLATVRSRLISGLVGQGALVSIAMGAKQLPAFLERWGERIEIAAMNGPSSAVLSGDKEAVEELLELCEREDVRARELRSSMASHSAYVECLREELLDAIAPTSPSSGQIPFHSTVTGGLLDTAELGAEYWYRNLREPVRFEEVTRRLLAEGQRVFVEISTHPVLSLALGETIDDALEDPEEAAVLGTLRRDEGGPERFALSLATAHMAGAKVDWRPLFDGARTVKLPTYPFQRSRYWLNSDPGSLDRMSLGMGAGEHPMLGPALRLAGGDGEGWLLSGRLSLATHPWLGDHALAGTVLLPGTAFLELALHAAERTGCAAVGELTMQAPLILAEEETVTIQVSVGEPDSSGIREISIHSRREGDDAGAGAGWTHHASGALAEAPSDGLGAGLAAWPPEGGEALDVDELYDFFEAAGYEYGPAFQGLRAAWRVGEDVYAEVSLPEEMQAEAERFSIHPALLDSALHAIALLQGEEQDGRPRLPFAWGGVSLQGSGASALRVALSPAGAGGVSLTLADGDGQGLARIDSLALREISDGQLAAATSSAGSLFALDWVETAVASQAPRRLAVLGEAPLPADTVAESYEDLEALVEAVEAGADVPEAVLWRCRAPEGEDVPAAAHGVAQRALALLQRWLAEEALESTRLVVLTERAIAASEDDDVELSAAPIWGLMRSAQNEQPGRIVLIDSDASAASVAALPAVLLGEEPQLALREGAALAPRLARGDGQTLMPPPGAWRLAPGDRGTLETLALVPNPGAEEPLAPNEVRVAVRAAGLNFRDVLVALGYDVPGQTTIGSEGSGVVVEVGSDVDDLAVGDTAMGLMPDAFGPLVLGQRETLAPVPSGWTFEQAAAMPTAYLTAYYGLVEMADLKPGEKVLIHAAAGGVGMAAVQIAQQRGAEVFATASPGKWEALRELGIEDDRIASSRDLEFKEKFLAQTEGEGVDLVLNSLANELIDASLQLLPRGGRFLEMGKTDIRDPEQVAASHPGVEYRLLELSDAGPDRIGEMLAELVELVERGALSHLPTAAWDVRRAPEAFRYFREAQHVGKVVLTVGHSFDPDSTVLVSGGAGGLGALVSRHLVAAHGARHLLLVSRSGEKAKGAEELAAELAELGAEVTIVAADLADREQARAAIEAIPSAHPLGAVIHTAGVLEDGTIESLEPEQLDRVLAPKVDAAWNLHELTKEMGLSAFVLFSALAATIGAPGQANYAAANTFLDALAQHRRRAGMPATSMAWGFWQEESGMSAHLTDADVARMERTGIGALESEEGLALFDSALASGRALTVPLRLNLPGLRAQARAGIVLPLMRGLVRAPQRRASGGSLPAKLAALPEEEREGVVLELVRAEIAQVLGHDKPEEIDPKRPLKEMGFDSLSAVELRNRLGFATGLRLPATLGFDYPTSEKLAGFLLTEALAGASAAPATAGDEGSVESLLNQARARGMTSEFAQLLVATAPFRPSFDEPLAPESAPAPVRLAEGAAAPSLICLATAAHTSGAQEYTEFAKSFERVRDLFAVPQCGFAPGELAPASLEAAIETQARAVERCADGKPFALAGYSSGGLLAHAVASRLEAAGAPPSAIVLLDSYQTNTEAPSEVIERILGTLFTDPESADTISTRRLTAMGVYMRLLSSWRPEQVEAPTLVVKATEPVPGLLADSSDWRCSWDLDHETVDVTGNHFTILQQHASETAQAVDEWLAEVAGRGSVDPVSLVDR